MLLFFYGAFKKFRTSYTAALYTHYIDLAKFSFRPTAYIIYNCIFSKMKYGRYLI